ncbi:MAG TPA: hypothetical protein GX703_02930 [Erysipelothrix sp.]|jgi:hypothetical protein|nr:hypothetical protein [Erysipelothrix sp.]
MTHSKLKELVIQEKPNHYIVDDYIEELKKYLISMPYHEIRREVISGYNRFIRSKCISSLDFNLRINVGDIVFCDFGQAYLNEAGFQHFGLVLKIFNYKAFVVPMSSNRQTVQKAQNHPNRIDYKDHLFYIGMPKGLNRPSVLFLNDAKFINTARIIEVKSYLNVDSPLFKQIIQSYQDLFTV